MATSAMSAASSRNDSPTARSPTISPTRISSNWPRASAPLYYAPTTLPELGDALRRAFAAREPTLIEVPVGAMPSPWEFIFMPRIRGR